jgi:hypothetical protein
MRSLKMDKGLDNLKYILGFRNQTGFAFGGRARTQMGAKTAFQIN